MVIEGGWSIFGVGCIGGIAAELLHWWNLRQRRRIPAYAKRLLYWLVTAIMVLMGGFVAWLYFGVQAEGIVAFHIGLSTPLLLQKLYTSVPEPDGSRNIVMEPGAKMRDFFTW